jgi:hypothetical protein
MDINIVEFKKVLKKATINFSLDSVQLNFSRDKIKSKMTTNANDAIAILDLPNSVIPGISEHDEHQFNFHDPNSSLMPYIGLIEDDEQTDINILQEKIILTTGNLKSNIFFCSPAVVAALTRNGLNPGEDFLAEFQLTDEFIHQFNMIKKIGMRFGKVYFSVSNKKFLMETTDKTNRFSNGLRFDLFDLNKDDLNLCFDYKNFVNVMAAIDDDYESFTFHLIFKEENDLGMIFFNKIDDSEHYFLMSKQDI